MAYTNQVDLGEIQIHKKVIGDIAAAAIKDIPGVRLARFGILGSLCDLGGYTNYPGVIVRIDKDGRISIDLRVVLSYGLNIPEVAHKIQEAVENAVEAAVNIELHEINVNIHAVERSV